MKSILVVKLLIFGASLFFNQQVFSSEFSENKSAHAIYMELLESTNTLRGKVVQPNAGSAPVTFGGEKEGSSQLITRVAGLRGEVLVEWFKMTQTLQFKRAFLKRFYYGTSRVRDVRDKFGVDRSLTAEQLLSLKGNFDRMTNAQVDAKLRQFARLTGGRPFSYLTRTERKALFHGTAPHQIKRLDPKNNFRGITYFVWTANFGEAQKHIGRVESTSTGWEIVFEPMKSFGEFEGQIKWFREELKKRGEIISSTRTPKNSFS